MTTDLDIQHALAAIILPLVRPDDTCIVRQTTLSADATTGDPSLSLTSLDGFGIGSGVRIADTFPEETLAVSDGWGGTNPLLLDFSKLGYSGLRHDHEAGTRVYTNLFDFTPWDIAPSLANGDPTIFIRVGRAPWRQVTMPTGHAGTFYTHIQYHRLLTPPAQEDGIRMNPNTWAERQEKGTRADLAIINTALLANPELITDEAPGIALQMAPLGSGGDKTVLGFTQEAVADDTWHLIATLDAIYVGDLQ